MLAQYRVPDYPRLDLDKGLTTAALEIPKYKHEVRTIVNYAIGYTPPGWTDSRIEDGRQAILTAFETLGEIGSEEAAKAIGTICTQLHKPPYNGTSGGPDYRPLEAKGLEALGAMDAENIADVAKTIKLIPVVKMAENLAGAGQTHSSQVTGLANLLNAYETRENTLTEDEKAVLGKYISKFAVAVADTTKLAAHFQTSADADGVEKMNSLLIRAGQVESGLQGIEESVSVASEFVNKTRNLTSRYPGFDFKS